MKILGIESSCDECSASVVEVHPVPDASVGLKLEVKSLVTHTQIEVHRPYGGVVPELASRSHLETVLPVLDEALKKASISPSDIDAIAVTNRPGLVGALLVGVSAAKSYAYALKKPLLPVHHLEGHAASVFLDFESQVEPALKYPLCLAVVSGGHTLIHVVDQAPLRWDENFLKSTCVGSSRDDAAGEAFDKSAKVLGFPYPGGPWIDRTAQGGNCKAFDLPRALPAKSTLDLSFSGLKTAVALLVDRLKEEGQLEVRLSDVCASVQEAIVDALMSKIELAIEKHQCKSLAVVGGVAANSRVRERLAQIQKKYGADFRVLLPSLKYCTDNGAMIAAAGAIRFFQGKALSSHDVLTLNALPSSEA